jgi:predicted HTH domain antitoxin
MKHKYEIGTKQWQEYVIKSLNEISYALLKDGKDMRSYSVGVLKDEIEQYFKNEINENSN